jgi:hypothetical protein
MATLCTHALASELLLSVTGERDDGHVVAVVVRPGRTRLRRQGTYTFRKEFLFPWHGEGEMSSNDEGGNEHG